MRGVAIALEAATRGIDVCYTRFPLGWHGAYAQLRHPLDYIGHDGGGGVGSGPGMTVGAALALKGSGRLPIAIMGDGDFLMGNTAVWTAAHYQIPCLMIVSQQPLVLQRRASTRDAWRNSADGPWRTAGSASASRSPTSTSPAWRARRARSASGR